MSLYSHSDFLRDDLDHRLDYHVVSHIVTVHKELILQFFSQAEKACGLSIALTSFHADLFKENVFNFFNGFLVTYLEFDVFVLVTDFNLHIGSQLTYASTYIYSFLFGRLLLLHAL
jgi:hypothetical protein